MSKITPTDKGNASSKPRRKRPLEAIQAELAKEQAALAEKRKKLNALNAEATNAKRAERRKTNEALGRAFILHLNQLGEKKGKVVINFVVSLCSPNDQKIITAFADDFFKSMSTVSEPVSESVTK